MNKQFYIDRIDALREAIERLPEDVRICSIGQGDHDDLCVQILEHPNVRGELIETWPDKPKKGWFETNGAEGVTIGWVGRVANGMDR